MNKIITLTLVALSFSACSTRLLKHCNQSNAKKEGVNLAKKWAPLRNVNQRAESCSHHGPYSPDQFFTDFYQSYIQQMGAQCQIREVEILAAREAHQSNIANPSIGKMELCSQAVKAKEEVIKRYLYIYKNTFCSSLEVEKRAIQHALSFKEKQLGFLKYCRGHDVEELSFIYQRGYGKNIKRSCNSLNISKKAVEDAQKRLKYEEGVRPLSHCPLHLQTNALQKYKKVFHSERNSIEKEEDILSLKSKWKDQKKKNSIHYFSHHGEQLYSLCSLKKNKTIVEVFNVGDVHQTLKGRWKVQYFNKIGKLVTEKSKREVLDVSSEGSASLAFSSSSVGKADRCQCLFKEETSW
jgi:hypothetical protein